MSGTSFALAKQSISQGTLTSQLAIPQGASLAVVRMTVATTDPQATVAVSIAYTDFSGVNPPPADKTLALAEASNELDAVIPITPADGAVTLSFPVTGSAGSYNALVIFK